MKNGVVYDNFHITYIGPNNAILFCCAVDKRVQHVHRESCSMHVGGIGSTLGKIDLPAVPEKSKHTTDLRLQVYVSCFTA